MADDDKTDDQKMSEDEKLAAEWEAAMGESGADSDSTEDDWDAAMAEAAGAESSNKGSDKESDKKSNVRAAPMEEFGSDSVNTSKTSPDLDVIMDIPVTISMEVGNTMIPIRNLLQLNQGSVIELDRLAGEPLDMLVNGTLIAHGEVVMVNDKFGIRLTDVFASHADDDDIVHPHHYRIFHTAPGPRPAIGAVQSDSAGAGVVPDHIHHETGVAGSQPGRAAPLFTGGNDLPGSRGSRIRAVQEVHAGTNSRERPGPVHAYG